MADQALGLMAQNLTKRFTGSGSDVLALDGINLEVPKGGFTSVIGPSGCGKSTLLRILSDLIEPTTGQAEVNGKSPREAREAREFGVVFQAPNLLPWRTVLKNVTLPLQVMIGPRPQPTCSNWSAFRVSSATTPGNSQAACSSG